MLTTDFRPIEKHSRRYLILHNARYDNVFKT